MKHSLVLVCACLFGVVGLRSAAAESRGEMVYREHCLRCHGDGGAGTKDYPEALAGDKSVDQLVALIEKTMPEDKPGTCTGDDAREVAQYIHAAFYSPEAQMKANPVRVELSRLTVRQYQNVVTDLLATFRSPSAWGDERGLRSEYYSARDFRGDKRKIERVDPELNFDFGEAGPSDQFEAHQFSIRWQGSVFAPDTGDYEFIVRTDHAVRLWVNDDEHPLIDRWVKSGTDTEFRASLRLLGGRPYPLKLEFSKAKQGVDDKKKNDKPVKAFISLAWKRPHHEDTVIAKDYLSPQRNPELFVLQTPFPPDDRSVGYERGTSISKAWDAATTDAAIEVADYVAERMKRFANVPNDSGDHELKLKEFATRFVERAFRRPLSDEQRLTYIDRQFQAAPDMSTATKRVVLLTLKSPRFLYREIGSASPDEFDTAARLSFTLWDSLPDEPLLQAARSGQIGTREQIAQQAERMAGDLRAKSKLREFLLTWLRVAQPPDLSKDPEKFPEFSKQAISDLRTSLELSIDELIASPAADYRTLLTTDTYYLNGRLAKIYGVELPEDSPFQRLPLQPEQRAGLISHPYLLAAFAYTATSSPIHRGVFISRSVLGRTLRPPPDAVAPLAPDLHPSLSTRERVELQTKAEMCQSCHSMINPLGFPLEHFDALGRYRDQEKERPINAEGSYLSRSGKEAKFTGAKQLAVFLAESEESQNAVVQQLFHFLVKQPIRAYGRDRLAGLRGSLVQSGYNLRKLMVEIAVASAEK